MKNVNNPTFIFGLLMAVLYIIAAFVIAFTSFFEHSFTQPIRYGIGALFLLYGIFRGWRIFKQYKDEG